MESWIRNQCSFYHNYRAFNISLTLKSLFNGNSYTKNETDPFLPSDSYKNLKKVQDVRSASTKKKSAEASEERSGKKGSKIWRRLSVQSLRRKRKEKKQEDKNKPMLPAVLRTYDKQKMRGEGCL